MIAGVIEQRIVRDNIELPSAELSSFENKESTKIYIDENRKYYLNDKVASIDTINSYFNETNNKDVILIADHSLPVKDINILLTNLYQNNIKNIKLLSNRNAY